MWLALDESQGASLVEPVIGGQTGCADYPGDVYHAEREWNRDKPRRRAVVTRLASTGTSIDQSVLLGGNGVMSTAYVFVDATGNVLVTGRFGFDQPADDDGSICQHVQQRRDGSVRRLLHSEAATVGPDADVFQLFEHGSGEQCRGSRWRRAAE